MFPLEEAGDCTPYHGETMLHGMSICTCFVQMDTRCNQVRRPFTTSGSGTLWVTRGDLAGPTCLLPVPMHGVPYPQPLTGHEPQYVLWGLLRVRRPRAGAAVGRFPTVPGVAHLLVATEAGLIRSPRGPPNPSGQVPCWRPALGVGGSSFSCLWPLGPQGGFSQGIGKQRACALYHPVQLKN